MAKAIALTRTALRNAAEPLEIARIAIVTGCALALILAGPIFPL